MNLNNLSLQDVKNIDMVDYLATLGYQPQKIRNHDYWYLSPLREEKTASFKVNRVLNAWYDHGIGKGGNLVDFGILFHSCSIPELLQKLSPSFSFHQKTLAVQQPRQQTQNLKEALEPKIKVIAAKPLTNPILCRYLDDRKIPFEIAKKYCKEVDFELNGKPCFAIGFENRSGGFELRNPFFKGSSAPKDATFLETNTAKDVAVFEGFFSFLSHQTLHQKEPQLTNFLVLNSLAFFVKSRPLMDEHEKIHLYLDRDEAGVTNTECALKWNKKYLDKSHFYKDHKDLNDYLKSQHLQINQGLKARRHF